MRLYEQLINLKERNNFSEFPLLDNLRLKSMLSSSTYIVIDNVAQFYFSDSPQEEWDLFEDFPNMAPPWPSAFYEWKFPKTINSEGKIRKVPDFLTNKNFGLYVGSGTIKDQGGLLKAIPGLNSWKDIEGEMKWLCSCVLFSEHSTICQFLFPLSPNGQMFRAKNNNVIIATLALDKQIQDKDFLSELKEFLHIPLLAISFTHCKNVEIQTVHPDKALSKAQLKRHGVPKYSYNIINIQPMTKTLKTEGGLDSHGSLQKALHICRGHFKDYRERGLFGKNKGLYWWDMHTRGKTEQGIARREYAISP